MPDSPIDESFHLNESLAQFYEASLSPVELLADVRYINEEFIAEGAIKSVYQVYDTHCARTVALARIKHTLLDLEHSIDFIREVQITSGFEHPNIIRVYDIGVSDGVPWFTMELTSGRTLTQTITEERISLNRKLDLFTDICAAIQYAHERDVLHLDLKPENISIGKQGQLLLGDWGIASSIAQHVEADLGKAQTQYGFIKGSPGFMAPEQAVEGYKKHPTSDIFGLGALLFYILTSEPPIMGDSARVALTSTRLGQIKSLVRSDIPTRLVPILAKALALRPQNRYQKVAALKLEVEQFRDGFATMAESSNPATKARLFLKRHLVACSMAAVLVTLLVTSSIYYVNTVRTSEQSAIQSKSEALIAKEEAQTLLTKFIEEQEARRQERKDSSILLQKNANYNLINFNFDQALAAAKKAVDNAPKNEALLYRLGFTHFIRQEFKKAELYLKHGNPKRDTDLIKLNKKYAPLNRPLTGSETVDLIKKIGNRRGFLIKSMFLYNAQVKPVEEHLPLVKYFLERQNSTKPINLTWSSKTHTLDLTGNPKLKTVMVPKTTTSAPANILSTLPIKRLILDDTAYNRVNGTLFKPNRKCKVIFK